MARARLLKPGFFSNEELTTLPPMARLLFAGLWTIADRKGRLEDRPRRIKADLFPYEDVPTDDLLHALASLGFIQRYEVDGKRYIQIESFLLHQKPHPREAASEIPPRPTQGEPKANLGDAEATPRRPVAVAVAVPIAVSGDPVAVAEAVSNPPGLCPESWAGAAAAAETDIRECADAWTNATGQTVTRQLWEYLEAWGERVGKQWVLDAIRETGDNQAKTWSYTKAILERWQRDGREVKHANGRSNSQSFRGGAAQEAAEAELHAQLEARERRREMARGAKPAGQPGDGAWDDVGSVLG